MERASRRSFEKWGMTMSERNPYELEKIPDFAMQPAREETDTFDPELYERLLAGLEWFEPAKDAEENQKSSSSQEREPEAVAIAPPPAVAAAAPLPQVGTAPSVSIEEAAPLPSVEKIEEKPEVVPEPVLSGESPAIRGEVVPVGEGVVVDRLQLVEMVPCKPVMIRVEEDILVPDVKPDLESILSMDGALQFTERDGKISGDLILQTLYVPQGKGAEQTVVDMESRIAFRQETSLVVGAESAAAGGAGCLGVKADARIESLEHSVVNERKYRVKAVISVEGRRYQRRELELFGGLKDDDVQLLQETMTVTDVALRKSEPLELEEELPLSDSFPEPETILRCDVTLVENHKQINRDKAVVSGTVYYTIMYLPRTEAQTAKGNEPAAKGPNAADEPILFQTKSEFTQFVPLGRKGDADMGRGSQTETPSGRLFFRVQKASAEPKESDGGIKNSIHVKVEGETFLELYREVERRVVTDAYHHQKELAFDTETVELMQLSPCGIGETTVREVIGIPEQISGVKSLTFLSGALKNVNSHIEGGKNVVEGQVEAHFVCLSDDEKPTPFDMVRQIPFRAALDLPVGMSGSAGTAAAAASPLIAAPLPDNEVILRELRYDRLNDRQIEVNASVQVNGAVIRKKQCPLIHNVGFVEETGPQQERPGLVLYIARRGDTLWKIARKYRTTMEAVAKINGIEAGAPLEAGTKLLIVK